VIPWLEPGDPFPTVDRALDQPAGLLAAGADLSPQRLIDAYRHGIFPWYSEGQPILWWSTDPRMVLFTSEFHISHSLRKRIAEVPREARIDVRCDTAFERVMRACAAPREGQEGTWISEAMIAAYGALHRHGVAHSVETWIDGELCGGLYGLAIGRMFFGESMFARAPDASKIALAYLVQFLVEHDFPMIDCQQETAHLASLGARPIDRADFLRRSAVLVDQPGIVHWPEHLGVSSKSPILRAESA
jgi:leucyl/phenylalanyl-tRNA--protein transferase